MSGIPTPQEFLGATVARVNERADKFAGVNWTMGYDFSADEQGTWHFKIVDGVAQPLEAGVPDTATVTVSGKFAAFFDAMIGKGGGVPVAFMTGKLKSKGDNVAGQKFAKMME